MARHEPWVSNVNHALNRWIRQIWFVSVVTLAFALPFELTSPWFTVGSTFVFTNVELIALGAVGLWIARQILLKQYPRWRTPLTLPTSLMLLALLIATLFAPADQWHAWKVTLRWIAGVAVGWMMLNAVDAGLPVVRVVQASVLGGVVVAALAWLEVGTVGTSAVNQSMLSWLAPFRTEPLFRVGGEARASSTLPYPTITAMYLEFIFFFSLGWLSLAWSRRQFMLAGLLFSALLLVGEAIVLTLTRSALIALVLAMIVVVVTRWPRAQFDAFARSAVCGALGMGLLVLLTSAANPLMQLRLLSETDRDWYRASYEVAAIPTTRASEMLTVTVTLSNIGQRVWEADGPQPTRLFYHWLSADAAQIVVHDGWHTDLPRDLSPGETVELPARVTTPSQAGDYILAWDMLRERLFWFSVLGAPMHEMKVHIVPAALAAASSENPAPNVVRDLNVDRATLWRTAVSMLAAHPLLGVGPGNFRLARGPFLNLRAWDQRLHANNTYLELFADAGVVGGVIFLLWVLTIVRLSCRAVRDTSVFENSIICASLVGALVAFLIHALTDYFLEFTPIYLMFWMTLGLLLSFINPTRRRT